MSSQAREKLEHFGFSDGHPLALAWNGNTLILDYENWEEKIVRFHFKHVASMQSYGAGALRCEGEVIVTSPEIDKVKEMLAHDWGTWDYWKDRELTQLVIRDDLPVLTVIFQEVEIEYLKRESRRIDSRIKELQSS